VRWQLISARERQVNAHVGAASYPGRDSERAAKLADHESTDNLQPQAGGCVQIESRRESAAIVSHRHRQPVMLPVSGQFQRPGRRTARHREAVLDGVVQQFGQHQGQRRGHR
jgi:hypothetical protein